MPVGCRYCDADRVLCAMDTQRVHTPNRYTTTESRCIYTYYFQYDYSFWKYLFRGTWIFPFPSFFIENWNLPRTKYLSRCRIPSLFLFLYNGIFLCASKYRVMKQKCLLFASQSFVLLLCKKKKLKKYAEYVVFNTYFKNRPLRTWWFSSILWCWTKMRMHNSRGLHISTCPSIFLMLA